MRWLPLTTPPLLPTRILNANGPSIASKAKPSVRTTPKFTSHPTTAHLPLAGIKVSMTRQYAKPRWLDSFNYKWGTLRLPDPVTTCKTLTDQNPWGRVHNPHGSGYG